jgi:hypothetical protein
MRGFHPVPSAPFDQDAACDLDTLLHPSQAFESPAEVLNDPDLSLNEKRAILASWASDACAVEAVPSLRRPPGGKRLVSFDEVMDALRALDKPARVEAGRAGARPAWRRGLRRRDPSDEGEDRALG